MSFEPGSILKRRLGGWYGQLYYHMGVYVGDGLVIHFNGEKQKTRHAVLRQDRLDTFADGKPVKLHAAPKNRAHARAVCEAALRHYQDEQNAFNNRYDFVCNNCESFCVHCFEVQYLMAEEVTS
jgi:Lecithin retinol acyltransferase